MRQRFVFLILVSFVLLSSFVMAAERVSDVRPTINVVFSEPVAIINYFLTGDDDGKEYSVNMVTLDGETTFAFVPSKSLQNGRYTFELYASDIVGNAQNYFHEFEVFIAGNSITLVQPNSIGVANATTFPVSINTSIPSVCKYTGIRVPSYDDIRLRYFDITGNASEGAAVQHHTIHEFSVDPDFPRNIYIVCKDNLGRENFVDFKLYSDITPPTLRFVRFNPNPIVEYPPEGELSSMLSVTASEQVICRWAYDENTSYSVMNIMPGYNPNDFDAYMDVNTRLMVFPGDTVKGSFIYYIQCEDRARLRSVRRPSNIDVDLTGGLQLRVISPKSFSRNTDVMLNLTTNRRSFCVYKGLTAGSGDPVDYSSPASSLSSSFEKLSTIHYRHIGTRSSGSYSINIHCEVPAGVGLEAAPVDQSYTYVIDTIPPTKPTVNTTTPVCGNTLTASFFANDSQSGISKYNWYLGTASGTFSNGTTESTSVSVSQYNNGSALVLNDAATYTFNVEAIDGAGNVGPRGVSSPISFDSTGVNCDTTPPVISLMMSETGDSVSIECSDDASGCNSMDSRYGTSYQQPCNVTQPYLNPSVIALFRTTVVCWSISDNADNVAYGSQVVDFNTSLLPPEAVACIGGVDADEDGYGERCPLGPDCDDTDPELTVGCLNGCVMDLDGDGYGKGCNAGNDCNGRNPDLTTSCPNNCISDNDGDEFGLGCDEGPDCSGDDSTMSINCPNGCIDDNDGDRYGLGCAVGFDCDGEDYTLMTDCDNGCIQDTDGNNIGMGCDEGFDCDGGDPSLTNDCPNGCVFDEDGDGLGFGCLDGLDCNGMNPFVSEDCPNNCVSDNDGDGYGWDCDKGSDCNDTNPYVNLDCTQTTDCKYDHDGDGFGLGCEAGFDCDDYDEFMITNCTDNCTYDEDCNSLPDVWQENYFNNTVCTDPDTCDTEADPDDDGYTNIEEYRRGSDPLEKDEVFVSPEIPSESLDADGDGMPDACERMYGLNPADPYDADRDPDSDGLPSSFECGYKEGMCVNWLNPTSPDSDNDGADDGEEIDAGTDPCDPDSKPGAGIIPIILIIIGLLMIIGSTGYLIYKRYYIPLVSPPPKPTAVPGARRPAQGRVGAMPGARTGSRPRRLAHHRRHTGPALSRDLLEKELEKRAKEREKILSAFGERKIFPKTKRLKKKFVDRSVKPAAPATSESARQAEHPSHVKNLSKMVGENFVDRLSNLTKKEADYMGRLASISQDKDIALDNDHVSKLASITKKVTEDGKKMDHLEKAFKESDMDRLDTFLTSGKRVDTFIKEHHDAKKDALSDLSNISEGKEGFDALSDLSKPKRKDVMGELAEITSDKARKTALSKMDDISSIESKEDLFKAFSKMSRDKHVDKNVFEVLLSYMLKSGKVSKRDVSEILFALEEQGVIDKKDLSEVFFNLGIK